MTDKEFNIILDAISDGESRDEILQKICTLCRSSFEYAKWFTLGGESVVAKIWNRPLDRMEILKIPKTSIASLAKKKARFFRGIALQNKLSRLVYPHVPTVYDCEWDPPFITMEFIPGIPITTFLEKSNTTDAMRMFCKILIVMDKIHYYQVIHRDLKPDNIVIARHPNSDELLPVLLDFSLAKRIEDSQALTGIGAEIGTPGFASPEQIEDAATADELSDIYSLGRLMYNFLTFKIRGLPQDEHDYPPEILDGNYLEIFHLACAPREIRYKSVEQFLQSLRDVLPELSNLEISAQQILQREKANIESLIEGSKYKDVLMHLIRFVKATQDLDIM